MFRVKKSKIHGKGLFAKRMIRKGTHLGTMEGQETEKDGIHVLWVYDDTDDTEYGLKVQNDLRFANHSSDPNAELDGVDLYALRTIREGDEITFHYGDDWE